MGDEGDVARPMERRLSGVGVEVLEAVVFLGDAQPAGADAGGAKTVKDQIANIMTYFKHRVANAMSESINSKI